MDADQRGSLAVRDRACLLQLALPVCPWWEQGSCTLICTFHTTHTTHCTLICTLQTLHIAHYRLHIDSHIDLQLALPVYSWWEVGCCTLICSPAIITTPLICGRLVSLLFIHYNLLCGCTSFTTIYFTYYIVLYTLDNIMCTSGLGRVGGLGKYLPGWLVLDCHLA